MSIQGNVNQGVNMATLLYRLSPEYEQKVKRKQTIKGMKEDVKSLKELQKKNTKSIKGITGITSDLSSQASLVSEDTLNEWKNEVSDIRELQEKRIQSAEDLLDSIFEARTELFGKDLSPIEKSKVEGYMEDFKKKYKEFKATSRDYNKAIGEYDEAIKKDELERAQRAKEKAEGIVHKEELDWDTDFDEEGNYVSKIGKEEPKEAEEREDFGYLIPATEDEQGELDLDAQARKRVKELSDEVDKEYDNDMAQAKKRVSELEAEVNAEDRAANSLLRAQQRQQRHADMMNKARDMFRNQYESGSISAYDYGKALAENGLLGGK